MLSYGPRQANLVLIAYASSEGSGEVHDRMLEDTNSLDGAHMIFIIIVNYCSLMSNLC